MFSLACSAGVFFKRAICSRKRHVETSRREEEMGRVKGNGEGAERKKRNFSPLPPPLSFFRPRTYRKGYYFILSPIFHRHKIKDGGYNNVTNTNKVSPTQITPALQAMFSQASIPHRQFLLAPTLPLNYPNIVTFHLVSGDLRGGNDKNILLKNSLFSPFSRKHFSGYGLARKGKRKNVVLCDNAFDHLTIRSEGKGEDKTWTRGPWTPTLDRVHGPLSWTGSMDPLSWTRSMDTFFK